MKHDSITNSETIIFNFGLGIRTHSISSVSSVTFSLDSEILAIFKIPCDKKVNCTGNKNQLVSN